MSTLTESADALRAAPTHSSFKVAIYRSASGFDALAEKDGWITTDADYARVSEWVEVSFPLLTDSDFVRSQLQALDARERKLSEQHLRALKQIQDARRQLLALPAPHAGMRPEQPLDDDLPF